MIKETVAGPASINRSIRPKRKAKMSLMARREELTGWLMAGPWLIGFLLWTAGPFGAAAYLAFTDYDILRPAQYTGLENFRVMLFQDELFWVAMRVTTVYAVVHLLAHHADL